MAGVEALRVLWRGIRAFVQPSMALDDDERIAIEAQRHRTNRQRVTLLAIGMALLHAGSFVYFWRFTSESAHPVWRDNLMVLHGAMTVVTGFGAAYAHRRKPSHVGEVALVIYMAYGTLVSINGQHVGRSIDVFVIVVVLLAFTLRIHLATWTLVSALGLASLLVGITEVQPDPVARTSARLNAVPTVIVAWIMSRTQLAQFVRELVATRELERQRQVLDRQLRLQLVDRSRELAQAVTRHVQQAELVAGARFADRFVVHGVLGRGGMGIVYKCKDELLSRFVAVKLLGLHGADAMRRFFREVEAMAVLDHPAIAKCLHVDVDPEGRLYQVHELVRGESLDRIHARRGPLSGAHLVRIGAALSQALVVGHAANVIHRDIKPANVMLTDDEPGLRLLDFGISKLAGTQATLPGVMLGTVAYMAPEQTRDPDAVAAAVDIYALGATLRSLAGPDVPQELGAVLARCLDAAPERRPRAAELATELAALATALQASPLATYNRDVLAGTNGTQITVA